MKFNVGKTMAVLAVWGVFAAVPVLAQTPAAGSAASGSSANDWTPKDVISLVTAIGGLIVGLIGAIKGTAAQTQAQDAQNRLNVVAQHLQNHDTQLTNLALSQPSPIQPAPQPPASGA